MQTVTIYGTRVCPYCVRARQLLTNKHVPYVEVMVDTDPARRIEMERKSGGRRTVPQIFIGENHVGGFDELYALERKGELDPLLNS
ncbi:MAG TPA: glutaredoxin 3 [Gammaproteobacteria bacterium]|nr:glutaredoxin 3 [Gammaproteobacteria bacterium]